MSVCDCGTFKTSGERWRVLERHKLPAKSLLKCLSCGWKWESNRQYVAELNDHRERSRSGMTDQMILDRIRGGSLVVDVEFARIYSVNGAKRELKQIKRTSPSSGTTYEFVEVSSSGCKKKIAVHRLVMMASENDLTPEGMDVDHIRGKKVENHNGRWNLRYVKSEVNQSHRTTDPDQMEMF